MSQLYLISWYKILKCQGFLSLEDDKEQIWKKKHWIGNYSMKCFPKILIYIKTNFFLYLAECSIVQINVFTLELCLMNYFFSWIGSSRNEHFSLNVWRENFDSISFFGQCLKLTLKVNYAKQCCPNRLI